MVKKRQLMDGSPTEHFNEINRYLFLLFDYCKTKESILAQQAATKRVAELKKVLKKEQLERCEK